MKVEFMNQFITKYPEMAAMHGVDPAREVHTFSYVDLKLKFSQLLETAKHHKAAKAIQTAWRANRERKYNRELF
jgi:hypothetical protein